MIQDQIGALGRCPVVDVLVSTLGRIATVLRSTLDEDGERERLRTYLLGNEGTDDVTRNIEEGRQKYGVLGVPFFVVGAKRNDDKNGKADRAKPYGLSEAQTPQTFLGIFRSITES